MTDYKSETIEKQKIQKPNLYKVIIFNDDYTTMEFVVFILVEIFNKNQFDSVSLMYKIHETGNAVAGIYTYDIALTKKMETLTLAQKEGFPLKLEIEEDI